MYCFLVWKHGIQMGKICRKMTNIASEQNCASPNCRVLVFYYVLYNLHEKLMPHTLKNEKCIPFIIAFIIWTLWNSVRYEVKVSRINFATLSQEDIRSTRFSNNLLIIAKQGQTDKFVERFTTQIYWYPIALQ